VESLLNAAGHAELPVVISAGITYLPIQHYAPPELERRLFFISDPVMATKYMGSDNIELELQILQSYAPLRVTPLAEFASQNHAFLLYSQRSAVRGDWWPTALAREGRSLELVAADQDARIYLVSPKTGL
jgi:hypothetical protein